MFSTCFTNDRNSFCDFSSLSTTFGVRRAATANTSDGSSSPSSGRPDHQVVHGELRGPLKRHRNDHPARPQPGRSVPEQQLRQVAGCDLPLERHAPRRRSTPDSTQPLPPSHLRHRGPHAATHESHRCPCSTAIAQTDPTGSTARNRPPPTGPAGSTRSSATPSTRTQSPAPTPARRAQRPRAARRSRSPRESSATSPQYQPCSHCKPMSRKPGHAFKVASNAECAVADRFDPTPNS